MKRAAIAIRSLTARTSAAVGLEGAFLLAGTLLLTYGSSLIAPFAPWLVAGSMCVLAGVALAIPGRRQ